MGGQEGASTMTAKQLKIGKTQHVHCIPTIPPMTVHNPCLQGHSDGHEKTFVFLRKISFLQCLNSMQTHALRKNQYTQDLIHYRQYHLGTLIPQRNGSFLRQSTYTGPHPYR